MRASRTWARTCEYWKDPKDDLFFRCLVLDWAVVVSWLAIGAHWNVVVTKEMVIQWNPLECDVPK